MKLLLDTHFFKQRKQVQHLLALLAHRKRFGVALFAQLSVIEATHREETARKGGLLCP